MDAVLLDTDVFSFLIKGDNDTRAALYRPHVKNKTIALSFVSIGEIFAWGEIRQWSARRRASVEQRIKAAVVVPYDLDLCREYGKVRAETTKKGLTVGANDLWIATCAIRHSLPLVTHNLKHFANIPRLTVISEASRLSQPKTGNLFAQRDAQNT